MTDPKTQQPNTKPPAGKPANPPPPQKTGSKTGKPSGGSSALLWLSLVLILGAAAFATYWVRNNAQQSRPVASAAEESHAVEESDIVVSEGEDVIDEESAIEAEPAGETSTGALIVTSDVRGADVYLNGRRVGKTPHKATPLSPGDYEVKVEQQGYESFQRQVQVETETESVHADLRPIKVEKNAPAREPAGDMAEASRAPADVRKIVPAAAAVNHRHRIGSCEGILRLSGEGIRFESDHKDAFSVALSDVEALDLDGDKLTLKVREGRKYDFNERNDNVDALVAFHDRASDAVAMTGMADQ